MNTQLTASSLFTELKSRIDARQAQVGIIGLGYVGLPLALLYSEQKFPSPVLISISEKSTPSPAAAPTFSASRPRRSRRPKQTASKLRPTIRSITAMDAIIICVPTPLNEYHEPDLSYITDTATGGCTPPARGPDRHSREHDLSRHHRRSPGSDSRKRKTSRTESVSQGSGRRATISGSPSRPSARIPATPRWRVTIFPR
jgi:hypothetical protein